MSKDYKKTDRTAGSRASGGSLLVGILIGLVLGLSIALGVAWYINKMPNPFLARSTPPVKPAAQPPGKKEAKGEDQSAKGAPDGKPRFEFYEMLRKGEQPGTDQAVKEVQKTPPVAERETFFLQAGAFQNAPDADNLKARLALVGVEAIIQTATLPDKGVVHRVRVGPYASIEELNRARETLKQNGYDTALIKVNETAPPPR